MPECSHGRKYELDDTVYMGGIMTVDELEKKIDDMRAEAKAVGDNEFGNRVVVLSSDGCGNQFKKLADDGIEHVGFDEDEEAVGLLSLDDELREAGFTEDDVIKDALAAIVLYPED